MIVDRILNVMGTTIVTTETQSLRDPTSYIRNGTDQKYAINETADSSNRKFWSLIVWRNVILFLYVHLAAIYGFYLAFTKIKGITTVWGEYCNLTSILAIFYMSVYVCIYVWTLFCVCIRIYISCVYVCCIKYFRLYHSFPPSLTVAARGQHQTLVLKWGTWSLIRECVRCMRTRVPRDCTATF